MPELSGVKVCRILRADSPVPIIMVTAKDSSDKVVGLELGADDYVTSRSAWGADSRVPRNSVRRPAASVEAPPAFVELGRSRFTSAGIGCCATASRCRSSRRRSSSRVLLRHPGQFHPRPSARAVWGYDYAGETRTVNVHVHWLRGLIEAYPRNPVFIHTVRRVDTCSGGRPDHQGLRSARLFAGRNPAAGRCAQDTNRRLPRSRGLICAGSGGGLRRAHESCDRGLILGDAWTRVHGDPATQARWYAGTRARWHAGTQGRGYTGTRLRGDAGTRARWYAEPRYAGALGRDDPGTRVRARRAGEAGRSVRLVPHPLDRLGRILRRSRSRLEIVVEVRHLMASIGGTILVEEPRQGRPRDAVGLLLELVDRGQVTLEVPRAVELAERRRQLAGLAVEDRCEPLDSAVGWATP